MRRVTHDLLEASTLCAISTVGPRERAHVNTAYFAWAPDLRLIWLSEPLAQHSRNLRRNSWVAVAVYDSHQTWDNPDRGIQLFGSAAKGAADAERLYSGRFPAYRATELGAFRFYELSPRRVKLFDERVLGSGVFVTARVGGDGSIEWEHTEVYRPDG
jgi:uncharacterized protein YhbP (UPF0306 family)